MQSVVFVNSSNQVIATVSMDVPRNGEQIVMGNQGFTVEAVRYFLYPGNIVHPVVLLTPMVLDALVAEHYQKLSATATRDSK
jgi:hypothetical protein